jgi:hypothetical protein
MQLLFSIVIVVDGDIEICICYYWLNQLFLVRVNYGPSRQLLSRLGIRENLTLKKVMANPPAFHHQIRRFYH